MWPIDPEVMVSFLLTLKLALVTDFFLLLLGIPLAWLLFRLKGWKQGFFEVLISLPTVLPPTVLGFYLLIFLGPESSLGKLWQLFFKDRNFAFSFEGIVFASFLCCLSFVVRPILNSFRALGKDQWEMALTLGASPWDAFFTIILPQAKFGILTAASLGIAHVMGQFGVILMVGGSIPGKTKVLSIVLFDKVESLQYAAAHGLAFLLLIISLVLLLGIEFLKRSRSSLWKF